MYVGFKIIYTWDEWLCRSNCSPTYPNLVYLRSIAVHGIDTKCNNWTDLPVGWLKSRLHMCVYWLHYIVSVKPSTWCLTNSDKHEDIHDHNNDYYTGVIIRKYIRETFRRGLSWLLMYAIIPRDLYMYRPTIIDSCSHDLPMVMAESNNATAHGINVWSRRLPLWWQYSDNVHCIP